jgi:branched-chain amino acid transport system ATP-binding protein
LGLWNDSAMCSHTYYGAIEALKGISIEVHEGEIVTLIGAKRRQQVNGAATLRQDEQVRKTYLGETN